ncbi:MAG: efflux RND transporter periplasmic adaptor subunit [Flavobacteriales bacterium]|nr:efflux RND transporter periplasmic adaptor subunit [Flavobacteriales bacterium]
MKIYFPILALTVLIMASCGGNSVADVSLVQLEHKRDSLKARYDSLGKAIAEIEKLIAQKDTAFKPTMVTTVQIGKKDFDSYFMVQGSVNSDRNAQVLPEMPGLIKKIYVKEGDRVSAGQKLAQLDNAVASEQVNQAEINLSLATDLFEKQENLWKQKVGSEVQYLDAKNRKENAQNQLATIKEQLGKYSVTAPFAGTVESIDLKEGELANGMTPLMRIVNLDDTYMKAGVSENYLAVAKQGAAVQVIIPNMDTINSTIARVGNFIKSENRTFEITVNLPVNNLMMKPNLVGAVRINDYHADSAVVLLSSLIMHDAEDRSFVFLLDEKEGKYFAKKTILTTGRNYNGQQEILGGLAGTERIIDKGARKLVDGQEVRIENGQLTSR